MRAILRAKIGRITRFDRFEWDNPGVALALLLFLGESIAVILAGTSLKSDGYDGGRLAALLGAAVLAIYVPLAVGLGKIPFAAPTEYERRRKFAEKRLGVKIPRTGDKMKNGGRLGSAQVDLPDDSNESIRAAVGRAYCLGDKDLELFCTPEKWTEDAKRRILLAQLQLVPPSAYFTAITAPPELLRSSQEQESVSNSLQ